jgi:hypothetical protein
MGAHISILKCGIRTMSGIIPHVISTGARSAKWRDQLLYLSCPDLKLHTIYATTFAFGANFLL